MTPQDATRVAGRATYGNRYYSRTGLAHINNAGKALCGAAIRNKVFFGGYGTQGMLQTCEKCLDIKYREDRD